jgi:hypothetical protein
MQKKPASLLVQFTCNPDKHEVRMSYQGEISEELLQGYYDKLSSLKLLKTTGEVKFQFGIKIKP